MRDFWKVIMVRIILVEPILLKNDDPKVKLVLCQLAYI